MSNKQKKTCLSAVADKNNKYCNRNAAPKLLDSPTSLPSNRQSDLGLDDMDMLDLDSDIEAVIVPNWVNKPTQILLLDGKTAAQRTRDADLHSATDKNSLKAACYYLLSREMINIPLNNFMPCWKQKVPSKNKKKNDEIFIKSVYDYDLTPINFKQCVGFILRQIKPNRPTSIPTTTSWSKQNDKNEHDQKHNEMVIADTSSKEKLGPELYRKLSRKERLYVKYVLILGPNHGNK